MDNEMIYQGKELNAITATRVIDAWFEDNFKSNSDLEPFITKKIEDNARFLDYSDSDIDGAIEYHLEMIRHVKGLRSQPVRTLASYEDAVDLSSNIMDALMQLYPKTFPLEPNYNFDAQDVITDAILNAFQIKSEF